MKCLLALLTLSFLFAPPSARAAGPPAAKSSFDTVISDSLKVATLDSAWSAVNTRFWDPAFGGVDWAKMKAKYLPAALKAKTAHDLHGVIDDMLGELKGSHLGVAEQVEIAPVTTGRGTTGIALRWVEGAVIVTGFSPDFAGQDAGVGPGDELVKVDGKSVAEIQAAQPPPGKETIPEARRKLSGIPLGGEVGAKKELTLRRPGGKEYVASVPLVENTRTAKPFQIEWRGDVAYMRIRLFNLVYHPLLAEAMPALRQAKGWIIDLRANPGGGENMEGSFADWLFRDKGSLGETLMRGVIDRESDSFPGKGDSAYTGPVAVLIDEFSGSNSEVLAAGLSDLGRAKVVGGRPSRGAVLPSTFVLLPTGAQMQLPIGQLRSPKGTVLEGVGVVPDILVPLTKEGYARTGDPILARALEYIRTGR